MSKGNAPESNYRFGVRVFTTWRMQCFARVLYRTDLVSVNMPAEQKSPKTPSQAREDWDCMMRELHWVHNRTLEHDNSIVNFRPQCSCRICSPESQSQGRPHITSSWLCVARARFDVSLDARLLDNRPIAVRWLSDDCPTDVDRHPSDDRQTVVRRRSGVRPTAGRWNRLDGHPTAVRRL